MAFFPAMAANSLAVVFGGKYPMDGGRTLGGKRILGDGKTWSGLIGGVVAASLVGVSFGFFVDSLYPTEMYGFWVVFPLSLGALLGDICSSFFKRRSGRERGVRTPLIDEYDFVLGALILTFIVQPKWVLDTFVYREGWMSLLVILILIPVLHRGTNIIGYKIGMKKEPW